MEEEEEERERDRETPIDIFTIFAFFSFSFLLKTIDTRKKKGHWRRRRRFERGEQNG